MSINASASQVAISWSISSTFRKSFEVRSHRMPLQKRRVSPVKSGFIARHPRSEGKYMRDVAMLTNAISCTLYLLAQHST
jgi:hypothetical protein